MAGSSTCDCSEYKEADNIQATSFGKTADEYQNPLITWDPVIRDHQHSEIRGNNLMTLSVHDEGRQGIKISDQKRKNEWYSNSEIMKWTAWKMPFDVIEAQVTGKSPFCCISSHQELNVFTYSRERE